MFFKNASVSTHALISQLFYYYYEGNRVCRLLETEEQRILIGCCHCLVVRHDRINEF